MTMRQYVRTKTYLSEDSPWFWARLWRALPQHPIATLPGGERDEGWSGVEALARAHHADSRRTCQREQPREVEIHLDANQARYHRHGEPHGVEMEGACAWKYLPLGLRLPKLISLISLLDTFSVLERFRLHLILLFNYFFNEINNLFEIKSWYQFFVSVILLQVIKS